MSILSYKEFDVPDKDVSLIAQAVTGLAAVFAIAYSFIQKANFISEVRKTMASQNLKISELERNLHVIELSVPEQFKANRDFVFATFPNNDIFNEKMSHLEIANAQKYNQIVSTQAELRGQLERIANSLSDMKNNEIKELKEKLKKYEG